jgi:hypothetical protein
MRASSGTMCSVAYASFSRAPPLHVGERPRLDVDHVLCTRHETIELFPGVLCPVAGEDVGDVLTALAVGGFADFRLREQLLSPRTGGLFARVVGVGEDGEPGIVGNESPQLLDLLVGDLRSTHRDDAPSGRCHGHGVDVTLDDKDLAPKGAGDEQRFAAAGQILSRGKDVLRLSLELAVD